MSRSGTDFTRAVTAALVPGSEVPRLQRVLGIVTVVGAVLGLICLGLTTSSSEQAAAERYAGLPVCVGGGSTGCVELIPGELGRSRVTKSSSDVSVAFLGADPRPAIPIVADKSDVAEPVSGMLLDGDFVGIQDARGMRFPARSAGGPALYWWGLIGGFGASIGAGALLSLLVRRRA